MAYYAAQEAHGGQRAKYEGLSPDRILEANRGNFQIDYRAIRRCVIRRGFGTTKMCLLADTPRGPRKVRFTWDVREGRKGLEVLERLAWVLGRFLGPRLDYR